VDPFAGSYVVESLTDEIEAAAMALIERIDDMGGAVAGIEQGFQKSEIERSAYAITQEIDAGERTVVGVNRFTVDEEEHYTPLRVNPAIEAEQCARLANLRAKRDQAAVDVALEQIREAARGDANLLYPMKDALRAMATVGEVSDALRDVWGQYQPTDAF
jgi:methylmalonyl-CoA mutase N-terminal domain/subunit